jgi:hypothetical protein
MSNKEEFTNEREYTSKGTIVNKKKDEIIKELMDRLSQSTEAIDYALDVLKEHGLGQEEDDFALELASQLAPNEELLIKLETNN